MAQSNEAVKISIREELIHQFDIGEMLEFESKRFHIKIENKRIVDYPGSKPEYRQWIGEQVSRHHVLELIDACLEATLTNIIERKWVFYIHPYWRNPPRSMWPETSWNLYLNITKKFWLNMGWAYELMVFGPENLRLLGKNPNQWGPPRLDHKWGILQVNNRNIHIHGFLSSGSLMGRNEIGGGGSTHKIPIGNV